jgi:hypothetical protein
MGTESDNQKFTAYIDGQPVEMTEEPVKFATDHPEAGEIETDNPDFSAGGTSAAALGDAVENLAKTWESISITATVAFDWIKEFFSLIELGAAINCAKVLEPAMADRYIHAKKKRTRKKYEKRIRTWFREVVLKCLD